MIYLLFLKDNKCSELNELLTKKSAQFPEVSGEKPKVEIINFTYRETTSDSRIHYQHYVHIIRDFLARDQLAIFLCQCSLKELNPLLCLNTKIEPLLAMLVLTFPEVRFFTFAPLDPPEDRRRFFYHDIGVLQLQFPLNSFYPDTIFDGYGLRDYIRQVILEQENTSADASYLPRRIQAAIALDEEEPYAALHAYTAYRFGFRGVSVTKQSLAERWLGRSSQYWDDVKAPTIIFEDLYLNFPDSSGSSFSKLRERVKAVDNGVTKELFPLLEKIQNRIFVSSGQRLQGDQIKWDLNKAYIQEQKSLGRNIENLPKPHSGIFSLWESSKLNTRLQWLDESTGTFHKGTGAGYIWPPQKTSFNDSNHGHSAPGVLLTIATTLLARATELRKNGVYSVQEAVRGAVLANEALELLGGRTPTESIEALSLKHQFEVLAECQFSGVEFNLKLGPRLDEIKKEVEHICRWFDPKKAHNAALNAEMSILTAIMRIFQENAQFDEEQVCRNRARHLHNTLWMRQHPIRLSAWPVLRYLEILLSSFPRFLLALCTWILFLGCLYWLSATHGEVKSFYQAMQDSITSFFSIGGPIHYESNEGMGKAYSTVVCLAIVSGFAHLGVFISHLYSILSRK